MDSQSPIVGCGGTRADHRLTSCPVRYWANVISALGLVVLFATIGVAWSHVSADDGAHGHGHAHVHVHHHGGSSPHHAHTHHHPVEGHDSEEPAAPECVGCPDEDSDEHDCCSACHDHHHGEHLSEAALPSRERDSVPTQAAALASDDSDRLRNRLPEHRQLWPYPRGRPPDHLVHLRTVVLLT